MTVEMASTMEKAESIPSMKRVRPRMPAQKLDPDMVSQAAGNATNARELELVLLATGESSHLR